MAKRLTIEQWAEAGSLYESGNYSLEDLKARFGVSKQTLCKRFKKMGIEKGSLKDHHVMRAKAVIDQGIQTEAQEIADRVRQSRDFHWKALQVVSKQVITTIVNNEKAGRPASYIADDLKALSEAAKALKTIREEKWNVLGAHLFENQEATMPELVIRTFTPEQIEEIKSRGFDESDDIDVQDEDLADLDDSEDVIETDS